jgi:hypothetical protein
MGVNIDSVKKLAESGNASGMAGMLGGKGTGVKDSVVAGVSRRYAHFFTAIVALSQDKEDDMVFNSYVLLFDSQGHLLTKKQAAPFEKRDTEAHYIPRHAAERCKQNDRIPTEPVRAIAASTHGKLS